MFDHGKYTTAATRSHRRKELLMVVWLVGGLAEQLKTTGGEGRSQSRWS